MGEDIWVHSYLYYLDQLIKCRLTFLSLLLTSVITLIVLAQPASQMTYQDGARELLLLLRFQDPREECQDIKSMLCKDMKSLMYQVDMTGMTLAL